jgi:tRNA threonylcarbamoyladenosine biosynthesis protein TsaB
MLLLAFDTAGPDCAVALGLDDSGGREILARRSERIGRGHAERLMPMINEVLGEAGVGYADLDRIAVTTGPGSFTGVRVGIAAARALALALGIPAIGVGSLQALALPLRGRQAGGSILAALDAKRDELAIFARDANSDRTLAGPSAMPVDGAASLGRGLPGPLMLTGSGAPILADALGLPDGCILGTAESPSIDDIVLLGLAGIPAGAPAPMYLRGAGAKPQADKAVALR